MGLRGPKPQPERTSGTCDCGALGTHRLSSGCFECERCQRLNNLAGKELAKAICELRQQDKGCGHTQKVHYGALHPGLGWRNYA